MKSMTQETSRQVLDVDQLLQDSYLLVVELQQGTALLDVARLRDLFVGQIEDVRRQLDDAGMSQADIDRISHAQCALLDETVLRWAQGEAHVRWASEPLQARFFSRHQAGEFLYEEMREQLRQPSANLQVLTVYQRVLMLGFCGRYRDVEAPEREQLLVQLNEQVDPMAPGHGLPTQSRPTAGFRVGDSLLINGIVMMTVLLTAWWGLNQYLGGMVGRLLAAQP